MGEICRNNNLNEDLPKEAVKDLDIYELDTDIGELLEKVEELKRKIVDLETQEQS